MIIQAFLRAWGVICTHHLHLLSEIDMGYLDIALMLCGDQWNLFKSMRRFLHPSSTLVTSLWFWYSLMGKDDLLWGWRRICCIWHMSVFSDILRIISPVGSLENLGLRNLYKRFSMGMTGLKSLSHEPLASHWQSWTRRDGLISAHIVYLLHECECLDPTKSMIVLGDGW